MKRCFVAVHDVTPRFEAENRRLFSLLQGHVGTNFTACVIPNWHSMYPLLSFPAFCRGLQSAHCEIALHGVRHYSERRTLRGALTDHADEFSGIGGAETAALLAEGLQTVRTAVQAPVTTFVPPAWALRPAAAPFLGALGLLRIQRYHSISTIKAGSTRLRTYSWDCGCAANLGWCGHGWGVLQSIFRPRAQPCVVFHPRDIHTGFVELGLRVLRRLLESGYQPARLEQADEEAA